MHGSSRADTYNVFFLIDQAFNHAAERRNIVVEGTDRRLHADRGMAYGRRLVALSGQVCADVIKHIGIDPGARRKHDGGVRDRHVDIAEISVLRKRILERPRKRGISLVLVLVDRNSEKNGVFPYP